MTRPLMGLLSCKTNAAKVPGLWPLLVSLGLGRGDACGSGGEQPWGRGQGAGGWALGRSHSEL